MLKRIVACGLAVCLAVLPVKLVAQSPGSRSMADRVAALEAQLAAALAAIADLQDRSGVPAGQSCAEGFFVTGFDAEGTIICGTTFPVQDATLSFYEGIDLETGAVFEEEFFYPPQVDFNFAYNSTRSNPIVLVQNRSSGVQILFLDGRPFGEVGTSTIVGLSFTSELLDVPFDFDDTIVVRTSEGNVFKVGEPVQNDDFSVTFRYRQLS